MALLNRCMFIAVSAGTGSFVVSAAAPNFLTPAQADASNATVYSYIAEAVAGSEWEIGTGTYTTGDVTLTRTPLKSSNSNNAVNFSAAPRVAITALVTDFTVPTFTGPALFADGTVSLPSIANIGDTDTGIYWSAANELGFSTAGTHAGLFDSSQRLILGHTASIGFDAALTQSPRFQLHGTDYSTAAAVISRWSNNTGSPFLTFAKSRSSSIGTHTIVQNGDVLGQILFQGDDGTNFPPAASIRVDVNNTPGLGDMPGTLIFSTTADGASTVTERLRISSAGLTSITGTFSVSSTSTFTGAVTMTSTLEVNGGDLYIDGADASDDPTLYLRSDAGVTKSTIYWDQSADALVLTRAGTNDLQQTSGNVWQIGGNTVWHAGNDGAGSGLDADLLDGSSSTAFVTYAQTSTATMSFVIDEDTMSSDSATKIPTQQSVKAYVDSKDTIGKQEIWIPASSMTPRTTAGAASFSTELATNDVMINGYDFDTSTVEGVGFFIALPKQWNEGTVTFKGYWTAASGSGTVCWSLQGAARSDDDAMDQAYGTAQTSTDTLLTANDVHVSPESSAITITGTPAAEDLCFFLVTRATGSDTLGVDARLLGIKMYITTDAGTDD